MTDLTGIIMANTIAAKVAHQDAPRIAAMREAFMNGELHFVESEYKDNDLPDLEVMPDVLENSKVACLVYFPFHLYERLRKQAEEAGLTLEQLILTTMSEVSR